MWYIQKDRSVHTICLVCSKDVSMLEDQDDSMFNKSPIVYVGYALWYAVLAHTDIVCYIMVFINQVSILNCFSEVCTRHQKKRRQDVWNIPLFTILFITARRLRRLEWMDGVWVVCGPHRLSRCISVSSLFPHVRTSGVCIYSRSFLHLLSFLLQ